MQAERFLVDLADLVGLDVDQVEITKEEDSMLPTDDCPETPRERAAGPARCATAQAETSVEACRRGFSSRRRLDLHGATELA